MLHQIILDFGPDKTKGNFMVALFQVEGEIEWSMQYTKYQNCRTTIEWEYLQNLERENQSGTVYGVKGVGAEKRRCRWSDGRSLTRSKWGTRFARGRRGRFGASLQTHIGKCWLCILGKNKLTRPTTKTRTFSNANTATNAFAKNFFVVMQLHSQTRSHLQQH